MLAWYLKLGGADIGSARREETDIDREIMTVASVL